MHIDFLAVDCNAAQWTRILHSLQRPHPAILKVPTTGQPNDRFTNRSTPIKVVSPDVFSVSVA